MRRWLPETLRSLRNRNTCSTRQFRWMQGSYWLNQYVSHDPDRLKQKHLLNTPVKMMQGSYWLNQYVSHDPDWLYGLYCRLQKVVNDQLTFFTIFYCKNKNKGWDDLLEWLYIEEEYYWWAVRRMRWSYWLNGDADYSHWLFGARGGRISLVDFSVETTGPCQRTTLLPATVLPLWAMGLKGDAYFFSHWPFEARRENLIGWFQCRDDWTLSEDNPFANNSLAIVGHGIERGCLFLSLAVWSKAGEPHWLISVSRRLDPVRGQPVCQQQSRDCGPWDSQVIRIIVVPRMSALFLHRPPSYGSHVY